MSTENNLAAITAAMQDNDLAGKYLTFLIEDAIYGVSLEYVIEIITIQHVATVPGLPSFIKGIINMRGRIVPVLDVRLRIGVPERAYDDRTCIIVIEFDDTMIGLIVDSVNEVATYVSDDLSALPEFTNINSKKYLSSISKIGDKLVLNLDCRQFLEEY